MLLPASQELVSLLIFVFVIVYILCFLLNDLSVCLHVCVFMCAPTGFKGGALCSHAPRAGAASFGHHDGELVQCVGLQARHHVVQAGGVGHLGGDTHTHTHAPKKTTVQFV